MPLLPHGSYRKTRGIIRRGTRADQPAANTVLEGTLYYVTDEELLERSTGAAWQAYSWIITASSIAAGTLADARLSSNVPLKNGTNAFTGANSFATNYLDLLVGQIKFPATQNASADANTLDDYEEGTWTPALTFGGGSTGITYSTQSGLYVKIGKLIFAMYYIILTSKGSSVGIAQMTGLPFTASSFGPMLGSGSYINMNTFATGMTGAVNSGQANAALQYAVAGSVANLDDTHFSNTSTLISGYMYPTAN